MHIIFCQFAARNCRTGIPACDSTTPTFQVQTRTHAFQVHPTTPTLQVQTRVAIPLYFDRELRHGHWAVCYNYFLFFFANCEYLCVFCTKKCIRSG